MKYFNIILLLCCSVLLHAQSKQDYIWMFGLDKSSSLDDLAYSFDFNIQPFKVQETNVGVEINHNNASICDKKGNLLFYTNGCAVMNREAKRMPNGDSLNYNYWYDLVWGGGDCLYGYPGAQNIMILPDPGYDKGYYVFHKPRIYIENASNQHELWYSYVDMTLETGNGNVVLKNQKYEDQDVLSSYFTSINHKNGRDWWILQPVTEDSVFLTYLLTKNGIVKKEDQNTHAYFNKYRSSAAGTARFSPDGTKYVLYNYYDQLQLYDFDRNTGKLSNHRKLEIYEFPDINDIRFSSVEWSSNSRFIYTASKLELHQIDTWEEDLQDGVRLIDVYNGTQDPFTTNFYMMALGPDCRIYIAPTNGSNSYHVINHPDSLGTACDFVQNGIKLPFGSNVGSMPNFPRFRVDEEEKCDPTIVSVFEKKVWYRRDLKVWPNPSSVVFNIELPDHGKGTLVVIDMKGSVVYKETEHVASVQNQSPGVRIDLSGLPAGRYNVEYWPAQAMHSPGDSESPGEYTTDRVFYGAQVVKVE